MNSSFSRPTKGKPRQLINLELYASFESIAHLQCMDSVFLLCFWIKSLTLYVYTFSIILIKHKNLETLVRTECPYLSENQPETWGKEEKRHTYAWRKSNLIREKHLYKGPKVEKHLKNSKTNVARGEGLVVGMCRRYNQKGDNTTSPGFL